MNVAQSIPEIFEAQARRAPDAVALGCDGLNWTYRELNERANQIAHRLRGLGVTANTPVALCLGRTPHMVAAILGVLKAGGAYVPIDSAYPKERIAFILTDTAAPVIVTQSALAGSLPATTAKIVCADGENAAESRENPSVSIAANDTAYIIYTSGSTGQPKGVMVTHHNVVRLFQETNGWYGFNERDVWTLFHSYAFDFSVWEIWGALLYGGRLVVVPYLVSRSPEAFYELLERERVTVLNQTPSAFRQLIWAENAAPEARRLSLRYVIFGGEALNLPMLRPWFDRHGDKTPCLINMYGITETTVHVTYRPIRQADLDVGLGSVIGDPIPDLEFLLLDEKLRLAPSGCPGEICIGGPGLAKGYLNRPELTAEKFIPHPLGGAGKLYRSGDLARRLPGGEIEYLGRMDCQVKIRGFRIELGEIESVLQQHPAVRECVADARGEGEQKQLVAYIVPKGELAVSGLREWVAGKLPPQMAPALFVVIDKIPLTVNGKADRRALPEPGHARPDLTQPYTAPANPREAALARIWQDVLSLDHVGRNDSFFELGGDSIRSIQALARAHEQSIYISLPQLFEHPTIAELASLAEDDHSEAIPPLKSLETLPAGVIDAYPMTKLQTGMVFHSDLDPASAVFHDVFSFQLRMPFAEEGLRQAIARLVERHPIFRTSFDVGGYSEPMQLLHAHVTTPFTVEDLRNQPAAAQRQALVSWVETEKRRRFDWSVAPLMRLHAQLYSDDTFQFIVSFHHAIMDGWSLAAMLTELFRDYHSRTAPAAPKVTYRDFVALERAALESEKTSEFWRKKMAGVSAQLLPRWPKAMCKGGREQVRGPEIIFPRDVLDGLQKLARASRTPLRTSLLAAHLRVMNFLTGHADVVTGLVTNGRPQTVDGEKLIGLFLNTLPLRLDLAGGTWRDLVAQTFAAEKEIIPHRRCPLSRVQQLAGGQALFETAFDFVQFHVYKDLPGYGARAFLEDHYFEANNFNFYVTFMLDAEAAELQMHFDYNPNEFCPEQIALFCGYYERALRSLALTPDAPYDDAALHDPVEQKRLLTDWNDTTVSYPALCVHQLFEAQTVRTPHAIAASFGERRLTYRELNNAANTLAARLHSQGAGPGAMVGIRCERSLEMLVCVLGVLKTGGAYVPLDPAYPQERLDFMTRDAGLKIILTKEADLLSQAGQNSSNPASRVSHEDVAYMIYTSGSTGQPKGVQVLHRGVVNFLESMRREPGLSSSDVLLAVTTLSFDIAGLELLLPLTVGAQTVIASSDQTLDFSELAETLERSRATVMQATPTTWRGLIEAGWKGNPRLKALCGGEALPRDLADQLLPRCGELWNMYGPTETTIWSTIHRVSHGAGIVPIGKPIANTQVFVLDPRGQLVPTGTDGEIYIGGSGLARGYFHRDDLTAEKFPTNPFDPKTRLYRTGDVGRFLPNGDLICGGRLDHQVKIRGNRIELGEIESALSRHPGVSAAVVVARQDPKLGAQLVAYCVSRNGGVPAEELRGFLAERLPVQMLPGRFVTLPELPLTPNGKIDRQRLPAPEDARPEMERAFTAPRTPIEKLLAEAWCDVLKIDRAGIHDNFFLLGGNSLLAMQVVARIRRRMDAPVSVAGLFEHPTIAEHALHLLTELMEKEV
ncbi:MAG TPA: amino acid adenylation domain-containing protein [Verrucomicrobiae bacterium]|nr:amino acid adenylation domain-containing protein [Verrucomicrobiae bacterium]